MPMSTTSGADIIFEDVFVANKALLNAAYAARHLLWMSFGILVYDHLLTIRREVMLMWRSPPSVSKYGFLLNRYMVPTVLAAVIYSIAGFISMDVSDIRCKHILAMSYVLIVLSMGISTLLVILRVIALWAHSRTAVFALWSAFIVSQCTTLFCAVMTIVRVLPSTAYNPISRLCYTDITSRWLMGAWVSEVAFDLAVLSGTCWNSLDRPRVANETLARALRRDGIAYFGIIATLRIVNLSFAATENILYTYTIIYASWAIITLIVSRLLLSLHALDHELVIPRTRPQKPPVFAAQTFSARSQLASKGTGSQHSIQIESWEMGVCGAVEIGKIESVVGDR